MLSTLRRRAIPLLFAVFTLPLLAVPAVAADPVPAQRAAPPDYGGKLITSIYVSERQVQKAGLAGPTSPRSTFSTRGLTPQAGCLWDCVYLGDVAFWYNGQVFKTQAQLNNTTSSSSTLTLSQTLTASNSWNADVEISVELVNAGVGFNATSTASVTYTASTTVPKFTCKKILAYQLYKVYRFNVFVEPFIGSDDMVGSGWAQKRNGVRYDIVYC
jgi:hypothetical protein